MLRLLLDEHISPDVADGLRRRNRKIFVDCMLAWEEGRFLGLEDEALLQEATARGLSLVACDRRTISPLLKPWAEEGGSHGGVIFVDEKTISPADIGGLVLALVDLWKQSESGMDGQGRISAAVINGERLATATSPPPGRGSGRGRRRQNHSS